ncbi:hypothetical protein [Sneathiella glossodoripedis]|uniref:hypothetical protein n=1 Tax=Sneathiella glossodoripedis TaxID=418853 RepID=UPI00047005BA|nr:hypothetical protein [Sneathiella glossodoripedis]
MTTGIHVDVLPQLDSVSIDPNTPLIVTDADEVLFNFMQGLELFLEENDLYFDWKSFALRGNIRRKSDHGAVEAEHIPELLDKFFFLYAERLPAVEGAAEILAELSEYAQVVVLSNVPPKYADKRLKGLRAANMDFPLIANVGAKGHVVRHLTQDLSCPAFFIDDIPHNHGSVREHAGHVHRLHFIADTRLAKLLGPAEDSSARLDSWDELRDYILREIEGA